MYFMESMSHSTQVSISKYDNLVNKDNGALSFLA